MLVNCLKYRFYENKISLFCSANQNKNKNTSSLYVIHLLNVSNFFNAFQH